MDGEDFGCGALQFAQLRTGFRVPNLNSLPVAGCGELGSVRGPGNPLERRVVASNDEKLLPRFGINDAHRLVGTG